MRRNRNPFDIHEKHKKQLSDTIAECERLRKEKLDLMLSAGEIREKAGRLYGQNEQYKQERSGLHKREFTWRLIAILLILVFFAALLVYAFTH